METKGERRGGRSRQQQENDRRRGRGRGEEIREKKMERERDRPRERWTEVAHRYFYKSEMAPGRPSSYEKSIHLNLKVRCLWTISFQVLFFIYILPSSHSFL